MSDYGASWVKRRIPANDGTYVDGFTGAQRKAQNSTEWAGFYGALIKLYGKAANSTEWGHLYGASCKAPQQSVELRRMGAALRAAHGKRAVRRHRGAPVPHGRHVSADLATPAPRWPSGARRGEPGATLRGRARSRHVTLTSPARRRRGQPAPDLAASALPRQLRAVRPASGHLTAIRPVPLP